jgi:hypothetical protein
MRRLGYSLAALVTAVITIGAVSTPAGAATGQVLVFETESAPVTIYEDPSGCHKLSAAAHVLINETGETVRIYSDPLCLMPSLAVPPGYGSHVAPGSGSFSV